MELCDEGELYTDPVGVGELYNDPFELLLFAEDVQSTLPFFCVLNSLSRSFKAAYLSSTGAAVPFKVGVPFVLFKEPFRLAEVFDLFQPLLLNVAGIGRPGMKTFLYYKATNNQKCSLKVHKNGKKYQLQLRIIMIICMVCCRMVSYKALEKCFDT